MEPLEIKKDKDKWLKRKIKTWKLRFVEIHTYARKNVQLTSTHRNKWKQRKDRYCLLIGLVSIRSVVTLREGDAVGNRQRPNYHQTYKLVKPLGKRFDYLMKRFKNLISFDSAIPLPGFIQKKQYGGTWMAWSEEQVTLDFEVTSSSPTLSVEIN